MTSEVMAAARPACSPHFIDCGSRPQHSLDEEPFHRWTFPAGTLWASFYRRADGYLVRFPTLADFALSQDGRVVEGWAAPGRAPAILEHLYLNQVLPLALSRQGRLVLHGSAIEFDGECIAFIGPSGRGKSTLAAGFARAGLRFLTDDGLHVEWSHGRLVANPSHPSIRLWRDSQEALSLTALGASAAEFSTKARLPAGGELLFCNEPRPVGFIFLLGSAECEHTRIQAAQPASAVMRLVSSSFLLDIDQRAMIAQHFDELSRVANMPIHHHLDYPRRYETLPAVCQDIRRYVEERQSPR